MTDPATDPTDAKYLSFLTPVGGIPPDAGADAGPERGAGPQYCGKAVFTDLHTSGQPPGTSAAACTPGMLTAQQKALEFLLFDLVGVRRAGYVGAAAASAESALSWVWTAVVEPPSPALPPLGEASCSARCLASRSSGQSKSTT